MQLSLIRSSNVCFFAKMSHELKPLDGTVMSINESELETIYVEIISPNSKLFVIGAIYRPNTLPKADLDIFISPYLTWYIA